MWDERYSDEEYAYGTEPNTFLAGHVSAIPRGRVLSLAEGEGRNAVFMARQGYEVTAVDSSAVGLAKAQRLAAANGVRIETIHANLLDFDIGEQCWDGIVSIFCPLDREARRALHGKIITGLKPGGVFLLEAYTPEQLRYNTGGGKSSATMTTRESLAEDLTSMQILHLQEQVRDVIEGRYHTGPGAVVQAIAKKAS